MRPIIAAIFLLFPLAVSAEASEEVACVQRHLNALGFDAGTVDGLFGRTTGKAGEEYSSSEIAADANWTSEPLTKDNAAEWCDGLAAYHAEQFNRFVIADGEYRAMIAGACSVLTVSGEDIEYQSFNSCFGTPELQYTAQSVEQSGGTLRIDAAKYEFEKKGQNLVGTWELGDYSQNSVVFRLQ